MTREDFIESMRANYGVISAIAKHLHICRNTVYDILEDDTLEEMRKKFKNRKHYDKCETAEEVLYKILDMADENPELASKQAQFILKNSKASSYNPDNNKNSSDGELESAKDLVSHIYDE